MRTVIVLMILATIALGLVGLLVYLTDRTERVERACREKGGVDYQWGRDFGVCWSADGRRIDLSSEQPPV